MWNMEQIEKTEWKVYFSSGFWKHHGRDRAGNEIAVGKSFKWNNELWKIPAVYVCRAGLVVDFCIEIEPDRIKQFIDKWEAAATEEEQLSREERELLESENPLNVNFRSSVAVNGTQLHRKSGYSMSWLPESCRCLGLRNETEWAAILKHYELDSDKGWVICRYSYPWDFKKKPVIKSLQMKLEPCPVSIPGMKFKSPEKGTKFVFTHPITGMEHAVVIQDIEKQELNVQKLQSEGYEYPKYFTQMSYTLTPELPGNEFSINDCLQSDTPKRKQTADADGAGSIGIIGGADGPTAVFVAGKRKEPQLRSACSALRFEPREEVEWKMVFWVKLCEDIEVELILRP